MKMRKLTALALCAVMVLGLLSGCQKPMDAQTLVQNMNEAIDGRDATSMQMTMDIDMTMKVQGTSMDMTMDAVISTKQNETSNYTDMDMTMGMVGISQEMNMEMYTTQEEGKYVSYLYSELDDTWVRSEVDEMDLTTETSVTAYHFLTEMAPEELVLDEEKQTLNEREVYVLRATLTGEQMQESFTAGMETMTEELDEMTAGVMENLDFSAMSVPTVFYIDAETFLPVKMEMEMQGMGDVMSAMMDSIMAALGGELGMEDMELTVEIPVCTMVADAISFDPVEVPAVPQEGIDAAAANPVQADGSYVLRNGENAVRIVLPEGYTALDVNETYLMFVNDDYTVYGEYSLLYTNEEELLAYIDEEEQYATDEEYFVSRSEVAQVGDFNTIQIVYTEDMTDYYAWKQLDGCLLDVMVSVMGPSANASLDALLECVENYEG